MYLLFRLLRRGARRESQVRETPLPTKKKKGKGGLTHRSPLKTNHYSEGRDNSSSARFPFSREKKWKRRDRGQEGGRTTWPRRQECNPKRTTVRSHRRSTPARSQTSSSPSTDDRTRSRAAGAQSRVASTSAGGAFARCVSATT